MDSREAFSIQLYINVMFPHRNLRSGCQLVSATSVNGEAWRLLTNCPLHSISEMIVSMYIVNKSLLSSQSWRNHLAMEAIKGTLAVLAVGRFASDKQMVVQIVQTFTVMSDGSTTV